VAAADRNSILLSCSNASQRNTSTLITCSPAKVAIGQAALCMATVNDTGTTPFVTPLGNVSFTSSISTGSFNGTSCVLQVGAGSSANCIVTYDQTSTNASPTIVATYTGDNSHKTSSSTTSLTVYLQGDINRDCKVDIVDMANVGAAFGSTTGSVNWNGLADLNNDGKIDILDIVIVSSHFGTVC